MYSKLIRIQSFTRSNLEILLKRMSEYCNADSELVEKFTLAEAMGDETNLDELLSEDPQNVLHFLHVVKNSEPYKNLVKSFTTRHIVEEGIGRVFAGFEKKYEAKANADLIDALVWGHDVFRSADDEEFLVSSSDIEYLNFWDRGESYRDRTRAVGKTEPLREETVDFFTKRGTTPFQLQTCNGVHVNFLIRKGSEAYDLLVANGHPENSLCIKDKYGIGRYANPPLDSEGLWKPITIKDGYAWSALGMWQEWHNILAIQAVNARRAIDPTILPVVVNGVTPGVSNHEDARGPLEAVCQDWSIYTDPIYQRGNRMPGSTHQKLLMGAEWMGGEDFAKNTPTRIMLSRTIPFLTMMETQQNARLAVDHLNNYDCRMPDLSEQFVDWWHEYEQSSLAAFHRWFYSVPTPNAQERQGLLDDFYSDFPCISHIKEDLHNQLKDGTQQQHLVRFLLAWGMHPKIAGSIMSAMFERNPEVWSNSHTYNWYQGYDPTTRGISLTRQYAGLIFSDADGLLDFNCQTHKERTEYDPSSRRCPSYAYDVNCTKNLEEVKNQLITRVEEFHDEVKSGKWSG
ncbi:MAG: hypothetical protein U9R08_03215 [Nanoarchaeota archaeon]|nr:hypothetical protein [Nanoarchaeota archaeon]